MNINREMFGYTRREVLTRAATAAAQVLGGSALASIARAETAKPPVILLRSGWQTINIGDIAHTPGLLRLLEKHFPKAEMILWANQLDRGVRPMLEARFPKLRFMRSASSKESREDDPDPAEAFEQASFMLHGSGPSLVGAEALRKWRNETGKPYGIFGVTISEVEGVRVRKPYSVRDLLDAARFVFTRETRSLDLLREQKIKCPDMRFVPDATFAVDLKNDAAAAKLIERSGLEASRFICAVPRLRWTPYWRIHSAAWTKEAVRKTAENEAHAEKDHAKLREVITTWVRKTGQKVLICPEMTYQVDIIRPLVFDPLPDDVKENVVAMDRYWLPDEASSVYRNARAVVSFECHSPIIAIAQDTPAFYLRQPTDTWKGQMYRDVGLEEWIFEIDETSGEQIADRLMTVHNDHDAALGRLREAKRTAEERFEKAVAAVESAAQAG